MTILQLGRQVLLEEKTVPTQRFVRVVELGNLTVDAALLSAFPGLEVSDKPTIAITGLRERSGAIYQERFSVNDILSESQTFYFDSDNQILYYHIPSTSSPFDISLLYGLAQGFTDGDVTYIDDIEYLPLIQSSPDLDQIQDIENYDLLAFIQGNVSIANNDGRLDELINAPIYGNDVIILYAPPLATTEEETIRLATLFVEDYDLSLRELNLRLQDRRKSQNVVVPSDRFSGTGTDLDGEVIPVAWGSPREIPAICLNPDSTTGNVLFRAAILLTGLGTVQKNVDGVWTTVSTTNVNLSSGTFEITAANGRDSNGAPYEVKLVSPTGIAITRLTDIIKDANERFLGVEYTESNYNRTEWESEETAISTGAYYLSEEKELFDIIRDIQNGSNVGFRYEVNPEGQRTIRVDDEDRAIVKTIDKFSIQDRDLIEISTDSSTLLAEVVIKYGESFVSGRFKRYFDDGSLESVLDTYNQRPRREYDTLLLTESLAQEKAVYLRNRFDKIRGIVKITLMGEEFLSLRIYDIIQVELQTDDRTFYGTKRCKILSIAPNGMTATNRVSAVILEG